MDEEGLVDVHSHTNWGAERQSWRRFRTVASLL